MEAGGRFLCRGWLRDVAPWDWPNNFLACVDVSTIRNDRAAAGIASDPHAASRLLSLYQPAAYATWKIGSLLGAVLGYYFVIVLYAQPSPK